MDRNDKETDGKLYRVYHKKGNHQNMKVNPDGSRSALQFTDENDLDGPLEIVEVDEEELTRTEYIEYPPARTFGQIILEEIVVPVALEALDIGFQYLSVQMEEKLIPKAKKKLKKMFSDTKKYISGRKKDIRRNRIKASEVLEKHRSQNTTAVSKKKTESRKSYEQMQERTPEEIRQIIGAMHSSAYTLAACIRMLNQTIVADDGSDPEKRLEAQWNLQALSTEEVMNSIDMLLEDKNRELLDAASIRLLSAFRNGNIIINDAEVPIRKYLEYDGNM